MLKAIRDKRDQEQGFTLIELMVVVLIIAILVAIAVPTFLGARERAQQKAAQSGARNGLVAAKVFYTDDQTYATLTATALTAIETDLTFVGNATLSTGPKVVSVEGVDADTFHAAVLSDEGTCYGIREDAGVTSYNDDAASTACHANGVEALTSGWSTDLATGW